MNKKQKMPMIHIGERIKEVAAEQHRNVNWIADHIPCERSNVYNIFRQPSIAVDLLYRLSVVLCHDFFADLSGDVQAEMSGNGVKKRLKV